MGWSECMSESDGTGGVTCEKGKRVVVLFPSGAKEGEKKEKKKEKKRSARGVRRIPLFVCYFPF